MILPQQCGQRSVQRRTRLPLRSYCTTALLLRDEHQVRTRRVMHFRLSAVYSTKMEVKAAVSETGCWHSRCQNLIVGSGC